MQINNENNENNDNVAAIGIGAMIVFIALILVAAVASAVIIQTAEKLQQNAESTGDDTTDEMSGKITVLNVFVNNGDNFEVYFRLAAGFDDMAAADILYQIICEGAGGTFEYIAGSFADSDIDPFDGIAAITTAAAGVAYRTTLSAFDGLTNDCGPADLFSNDVKATLYIHVVGGGTTYDILKVSDASVGSVVV